MVLIDYHNLQDIVASLNTRLQLVETREGPPNGSLNATLFDVRADGITDDTTAWQALIDRITATGGGTIFLPAGRTSIVRGLFLKSNVTIMGPGTLKNVQVVNNTIIEVQAGQTGWAIRDLRLIAPTTVDFMQGININGASNGVIENVSVTGCTHYGVTLSNSATRIRINGLRLIGMRHNPGFGTGGVGLWLFRGITDCLISNVYVEDCASMMLSLDAGTTGGGGIPTRRNTLVNFVGVNVNSGGGEKAIEVEGASDNVFSNFVIDGAGNRGIEIQFDQSSISSNGNLFTNFVMRNLGGIPINVVGGSRNVFAHMQITAFNLTNPGSPELLVIQEATAFAGASANDNDFSDIIVDNSALPGNYQFGVVFVATGPRTAMRNRLRNINWGALASQFFYPPASTANIPYSGTNANLIEVPVTASSSPAVALQDAGNAGPGATFSVTAASDAFDGVIIVTVSATPPGTGGLVRLVWSPSLAANPKTIVISPVLNAIGGVNPVDLRPYIQDLDAGSFAIGIATAPTPSGTYRFAYHVTPGGL